MTMNFIVEKLTPEVVYALGSMILHILWQGIIIAMVLGLFLILMRKSSAHSRYIISVISIFLFPVTALITFIKIFRSYSIQQEILATNPEAVAYLNNGDALLSGFINIYREYIPVVVMIWFIGITILMLRYMGLLVMIERLRNHLVSPVTDRIQQLVKTITQKFEIQKKIKTLFSSKITSPMVIGHFKPVLLLPHYTVKQLSDNELEVVLQHELAHIKRSDYLVNLLQYFIEILFFFHPAAWWVSSIVRKEREECCDYYAVKSEQDKITLANALTTIHEINLKTHTMALSLINRKYGLFNRINNLFNKSKLATFKEGLAVAFFLFFTVSLM